VRVADAGPERELRTFRGNSKRPSRASRENLQIFCHHKALPASGFGLGQGSQEYLKTAILRIQAANCENGNLS